MKQKFHFLRSNIEVSYLDPLTHDIDVSKYSVLFAIMSGLFNEVITLFEFLCLLLF